MTRKNTTLPALYYERLDNMRTTIYIDTILLDKLKNAVAEVGESKDVLIELLIQRIIDKNRFVPKPCKRVKYQDEGPGGEWKVEHINIKPLFYEKAQDLRRHFKYSVSWFIAFAIKYYLDELISDLKNPGKNENNMVNYTGDYVYFSEMAGSIRVFLTMMDTQSKKT